MNGKTASILNMIKEMVHIPTQGGIDDTEPMLRYLTDWYASRGMKGNILKDENGKNCAFIFILGEGDGPLYCLNACGDTADIGNPAEWSRDPFSAEEEEGWLYGRGSCDSRAGVAIFSHILHDLFLEKSLTSGRLAVMFDVDEHTGNFGGVKALVRENPDLAGVMIGYPGFDEVVCGARGFYRVELVVSGKSGHTGMAGDNEQNALRKGAALIEELYSRELSALEDKDFPFGPKLTVTKMRGGNGFSVVPDDCRILVDVRLTNTFDAQKASGLLCDAAAAVDERFPSPHPTAVNEKGSWPPYVLPSSSVVASALHKGASSITGRDIPRVVCGPSNIGNYLFSLGIEATCGFGVKNRNFHGIDECIEIVTIDPVYRSYREAVDILFGL
ncbi:MULTISPECIES: M20 family metallopeptidase [unclassified Oceanispirochaeta]|uniref:M20 family metallopeptidase n=1 Tax=unclassified Oceanispirochaeta TaxID=2635722 RepID=UPI000E093D74|nr:MULTISPECIES: M20/M25/M40 family metallo-hydrolase [unclassified Oceanispirochaeta]MBF9016757.1 M20/M25/M40 family metallo-hydrolase [Oceanispirochaeta sp. M2]NPD72027.1 M20/M25/M40 family metallo-hydrolase [Oceanispirochaeta sp. M1]RDG32471.1 M20 family peptidase [Oceanispirochaeta sp. M1]